MGSPSPIENDNEHLTKRILISNQVLEDANKDQPITLKSSQSIFMSWDLYIVLHLPKVFMLSVVLLLALKPINLKELVGPQSGSSLKKNRFRTTEPSN